MLTPRILVPVGAAVLVAAIAAIAVTAPKIPDVPSRLSTRPAAAHPAPSALDEMLAHCAELGEVGGRDLACLKAWSQSRRRFLGAKIQWPDDPTAEDHVAVPKTMDIPRGSGGPITGQSSVPLAPGADRPSHPEAR